MNKYKKLFGNTLVFAVGSFGTKLLGFLLVALYTRVMSEGEYSTVDLIYQAVNILVPLVTFSMSDAVIRFGMDNEYDHRKVYTCANLCVLFGMTVFMLFTPLVSKINTIGDYSFLLYIYCYFSCFRQIASQYVRGNGRVEPLCYAVKDGHILGSEHYCRTQISVTLYIGWHSHFLDYLRNCSFKAALAACPQRRLFSVRCRSVAKIFLQKLFKFPFPAAAMDKAKFVKCRRFRCDNKTWRIMLDVLEKAEYL